MTVFKDFRVVLTTLCGLTLVLSLFIPQPGLAYISCLCGSYFALSAAASSVKRRELDGNMLMVLAAIGAIVVDFLGVPNHPKGSGARDAAALLFLFSLSGTLEAFAFAKTKSAIEGLVKLRPSQALLVVDGVEQRVPVEQ